MRGAAGLSLLLVLLWAGAALALGPSYDCSGVEPGGVEALVCGDEGLSALDRELAGVYGAALLRAAGERPSTLKPEQRGWLHERDACICTPDPRQCTADSYRRRMAALTARYDLAPPVGQARFTCADQPGAVVLARFYATEPGVLVIERGGRRLLMFQERSASGARYAAQGREFWEHQGEALAIWTPGAPQVRCVQAP